MLSNIMNRNDLYPSVLVSVRGPVSLFGKKELRDSLSLVDWHMPASLTPMNYAISVRSDDTIRNMISNAGHFVVNFMSPEHENKILACSRINSQFTDIFNLFNLGKLECEKVESPRIKESKAHLECEVIQELNSGDHTVFLGRVVGGSAKYL